jgi:hypothetical protein
MKAPTPDEVWRKLVEEAGEDEIERAANRSIEDVERELAALGFDVAAERAEAKAFLEALRAGRVDSGERPVSGVFAVAAAQGGSEKEGEDERGR